MSGYANRICPILRELDGCCAFDKPVLISDLLVLFKKHAGLNEIKLIGAASRQIKGVHLHSRQTGDVNIIYQRCEIHFSNEPDPGCPACQWERYIIAKELVHALDQNGEKTEPGKTAEMLIDQLVRRAHDESDQATADIWGEVWAIELLIRFRHRKLVVGGFALAQAKAQNDYSYLARQYGVPQHLVSHAFSDRYMSAMAELRQSVGLSTQVPDIS